MSFTTKIYILLCLTNDLPPFKQDLDFSYHRELEPTIEMKGETKENESGTPYSFPIPDFKTFNLKVFQGKF